MATKRRKRGLGAVTPRQARKVEAASYRAPTGGRRDMFFRASVTRSLGPVPKGDRYMAVVCPASKATAAAGRRLRESNSERATRASTRCGAAHGETPTEATQKALRQMASRLK